VSTKQQSGWSQSGWPMVVAQSRAKAKRKRTQWQSSFVFVLGAVLILSGLFITTLFLEDLEVSAC